MDKVIRFAAAFALTFFAMLVMLFVTIATPFFCLYAFGKGGMKILSGFIMFFIGIIIEIKERWLGGL